MRRSWKWLAAAWLALAGCEGTEVGNPEVTVAVTAQVAVIESAQLNHPHPDQPSINQLEYFFTKKVLTGTKSTWDAATTPRFM